MNKVIVVSMPTQVENERLTNERITEANKAGWDVIGMADHNGYLVFLLSNGHVT